MAPPAIGFKLLLGPIVKSPQDSAFYNGKYVSGYKNLPITSFSKYVNGTDPDSPEQTFNYMKGLTRQGSPYMYNGQILNFQVSGNPVTGSGDLDAIASDRRMMASTGPFTFTPQSTQFVIYKMSVGQSTNNLASISALKSMLDLPFQMPFYDQSCCFGYRGNIDNSFDDGSTESSVDISDLVYLADYLYTGGSAPACLEEANIDGDFEGIIDISDLVLLVDFMFVNETLPKYCY